MTQDAAGKELFKKYNRVIVWSAALISVFPKWMVALIWNAVDKSESRFAVGVRYVILKGRVAKLGENVFIGRGVVLKNINNLIVGDNVSIHAYCYVDGVGGCEIGDNVSIA